MVGITFPVWESGASVGLLDILEVLGHRVRQAFWRVRVEEAAPGSEAQRLYALSSRADLVPGDEVLELATHGMQLIDAELVGWDQAATDPWVVIRAVDSTSWDILSIDPAVLERAQQRFAEVAPLPGAFPHWG